MRVALSLLFFSAVLFLPCVAPATETAQASNMVAGVSEPSPGTLAKLFGWFKNLGNLKLDGQAADDEARRYQDGQYVYLNGGTKGYHFVADLTPDFKPGFYVETRDGGPVTAELSLNDPVTVDGNKDAQKPGGSKKFCLFLGPGVEHSAAGVRDNSLGPDMPYLNSHPSPDSSGADVGIRCGATWKFD